MSERLSSTLPCNGVVEATSHQHPKPEQNTLTRAGANLEDPTVKSLVMFLVFVCAALVIGNFFLGIAAMAYNKPWAGGALFTGSGTALGVAFKLVKLLAGR